MGIKPITMAKITVEIPQEKINLFLQLLNQYGFQGITTRISSSTNTALQQSNHPYFDWEFYQQQLLPTSSLQQAG
jgi:hypothetical protein